MPGTDNKGESSSLQNKLKAGAEKAATDAKKVLGAAANKTEGALNRVGEAVEKKASQVAAKLASDPAEDYIIQEGPQILVDIAMLGNQEIPGKLANKIAILKGYLKTQGNDLIIPRIAKRLDEIIKEIQDAKPIEAKLLAINKLVAAQKTVSKQCKILNIDETVIYPFLTYYQTALNTIIFTMQEFTSSLKNITEMKEYEEALTDLNMLTSILTKYKVLWDPLGTDYEKDIVPNLINSKTKKSIVKILTREYLYVLQSKQGYSTPTELNEKYKILGNELIEQARKKAHEINITTQHISERIKNEKFSKDAVYRQETSRLLGLYHSNCQFIGIVPVKELQSGYNEKIQATKGAMVNELVQKLLADPDASIDNSEEEATKLALQEATKICETIRNSGKDTFESIKSEKDNTSEQRIANFSEKIAALKAQYPVAESYYDSLLSQFQSKEFLVNRFVKELLEDPNKENKRSNDELTKEAFSEAQEICKLIRDSGKEILESMKNEKDKSPGQRADISSAKINQLVAKYPTAEAYCNKLRSQLKELMISQFVKELLDNPGSEIKYTNEELAQEALQEAKGKYKLIIDSGKKILESIANKKTLSHEDRTASFLEKIKILEQKYPIETSYYKNIREQAFELNHILYMINDPDPIKFIKSGELQKRLVKFESKCKDSLGIENTEALLVGIQQNCKYILSHEKANALFKAHASSKEIENKNEVVEEKILQEKYKILGITPDEVTKAAIKIVNPLTKKYDKILERLNNETFKSDSSYRKDTLDMLSDLRSRCERANIDCSALNKLDSKAHIVIRGLNKGIGEKLFNWFSPKPKAKIAPMEGTPTSSERRSSTPGSESKQ